MRDGVPAGFVSSAAFGHTRGQPVAMGYIHRGRGEVAVDAAWLQAGRYEIDLAGELLPATVHLRAPVDPAGLRIKA